jgi:hypothetical protein
MMNFMTLKAIIINFGPRPIQNAKIRYIFHITGKQNNFFSTTLWATGLGVAAGRLAGSRKAV